MAEAFRDRPEMALRVLVGMEADLHLGELVEILQLPDMYFGPEGNLDANVLGVPERTGHPSRKGIVRREQDRAEIALHYTSRDTEVHGKGCC